MWYLQYLHPVNGLQHVDAADSTTAGCVAYTLAVTYDVPVHVWGSDSPDYGYDILPSGQLVVTNEVKVHGITYRTGVVQS